jgi:hypothetical protein
MEPRGRVTGGRVAPGLVAALCAATAAPALADGATRNLPETYEPGVLLSVSIQLVAAPDSTVVGLEDVPPSGWMDVSSISDGGSYDFENHKVKWPPFFDNFSRTVTYTVTPPGTAGGIRCFSGYVSIDGAEQSTGGDQCITPSASAPTVSELGLIVMALLLLVSATLVLRGAASGRQHRP